MPRGSWNGWLERRLPVAFVAVLVVVVVALVVTAYRHVRTAAVRATTTRLELVTGVLLDLLTTSRWQLATAGRQVADKPALARYLRAPLARDQREALAALQPIATQTQIVEVQLWDANGTRVLSTRPELAPLSREATQATLQAIREIKPPPTPPTPPPPSTPPPTAGQPAAPSASPPAQPQSAAIGAIRRWGRGDTLVYSVTVPVTDSGHVVGYVSQVRRVTGSPQGSRLLSQLIGSGAGLFFGNTAGDIWTDFAGQVTGPPDARDTLARAGDTVVVSYTRGNARYLAAPARIPDTPWLVMVEFPQGPVLAPARAFLLRMGVMGFVLVIGGAAGAWALSRRLRRLQRQVATRTVELQESEERLRGVTETAHDAIIAADQAGHIAFWNPGAERVFGYSASEALGQPLTMIMPERFRDAHRAGIARYVAGGAARVVGGTVELEGRRKDGVEFPIELSLAASRTEAGLRFTAVIRDITERKHIERALKETNAELESFSYSVSHDLRAPLRAIHGFARILQEDHGPGLDTEAKRLLGVINDNTRRMGQLIDDLLAFSRLGRKEIEATHVDMTDLVHNVTEEVRRAEGERALDIAIAPLPPARGDRQLLRQAVTNLVQNAAKFTRRRRDARIEVGHRTDGGEGVYYVKDNGAGFDPRYKDKLFGVFQRLHPDEQFEGTGVGLAIVQRIIHRHGGRVWAESQVDQGATFYFTLAGDPQA